MTATITKSKKTKQKSSRPSQQFESGFEPGLASVEVESKSVKYATYGNASSRKVPPRFSGSQREALSDWEHAS